MREAGICAVLPIYLAIFLLGGICGVLATVMATHTFQIRPPRDGRR